SEPRGRQAPQLSPSRQVPGRYESGRGRLRAPAAGTQAYLAITQRSATSSHGREEGGRAFNGDCPMSEITALLDALPPDHAASAAQLFPLVYDDLRRLAAHRLAHEAPWRTRDP